MPRQVAALGISIVLSLGVLFVPAAAKAAPCIIGPVTKSATFKYLDQWDSQLLGYNVYQYVKITGSACYNNVTSFGQSISTTFWGALGADGAFGPGFYTTSGTTYFWYTPEFHESFNYQMWTYPRLRITKTGVWSCLDAGAVTKSMDGTVMHGPEFDPVFISCWLS